MNKNKTELVILKVILATYIAMAFILAGLNFGYAQNAPENVADLINGIWHFYENWIKTLFIIIGGYLTLQLRRRKGGVLLQRKNIIGFLIAALVFHILGPYLFNNPELYYFAMPVPWTNQPLQLMVPGTEFRHSFIKMHGNASLLITLLFYFLVTAVVFIGTIIRGRRWQCSTLCLFSGFVSEVFSEAFPLIGKKRQASNAFRRILFSLKWLSLAIALMFTSVWLLSAAGYSMPVSLSVISKLEIYKYLLFDLIAAMVIWTLFSGRGYCYYCPLGTVVGLIGKIADQRIVTNISECIKCGRCSITCPMGINILQYSAQGKDVRDLNCVGCGHCIDACPTGTLAYRTKYWLAGQNSFLPLMKSNRVDAG